MPGTVQEAARLLHPGGHVCLTVSHPAMDLGRFVQTDSGDVFTVRPAYFESRRVDDTIEMDGLAVTCHGWTYTLEDYMAAFESAGLAVEALREPRPTAPSANFERWLSVPLFLMARLVKLR